MVASYLCLIIEIANLVVYADLYIVNKFKTHIFTPLLVFLPKEKIKSVQK